MRPTNEQTLKHAIGEFLDSRKMKGKLAEVNIVSKWEQIVGAMIAKKTSKIYFKSGKLFIHIDSAPLRQELQFSRSKIVELVNKEAGHELIDEVVVR